MLGFALLSSLVCAQKRALLVIDVQLDFLPNGALAVPGGEEVISVINGVRSKNTFDLVVFTQDWHTPAHVSFASSHGMPVFSTIELSYAVDGSLCGGASDCADVQTRLNQTLWPDHCVQNSSGAELHPDLWRDTRDPVVRKGYRAQIDSYSAFWDNGHVASTNLDSLLKAHGISQIFVAGLALDYCVFFTAMDGPPAGYSTFVIHDAARGISPAGIQDALSQLRDNHITVLNASDIPAQSCSVIETSPGCALSVASLNTTQVDHVFAQLCDRFNRSYVTPDWCTNVLQARFGGCSAQQRLDYALSVWQAFAGECCASLKDFSPCGLAPLAPSPSSSAPSEGLSNALVAGLVGCAALLLLGAACLAQSKRGRRRDKELGTPLVDQGFSAI